MAAVVNNPQPQNQPANQPQAAAAPAVAHAVDYFGGATFPDMINGDVATIVPAPPRESIPKKYRWVMWDGLNAANARENFAPYFRATLLQLVAPSFAQMAQADRDAAIPQAIALAAARIGVIVGFRVTNAHIFPAELRNNVVRPTAAGDTITLVNAATAATANDIGAAVTWVNGVAIPAYAAICVGHLATFALGLPVLAGWSLITYGHHYLSDHPSSKAYATAWRQASSRFPTELKERLGMSEADWFDTIGHKAMHPVIMEHKKAWARAPAMKQRLEKAGFPGATVRLPPIPSEGQIAKACRAVIVKAIDTLSVLGATVTTNEVDHIVHALETADTPDAETAAIAAARAWSELNGAFIAMCAGIIQFNNSTNLGRAVPETTLSAYSVRKMMESKPGEVSRGQNIAKAARDTEAERLTSGQLNRTWAV